MSSNDPRYDESPYASDEPEVDGDWLFDLVMYKDGTLGLEASVSPENAIARSLTRAQVRALVVDMKRTLSAYPYPEEK